MSEWVEKVTADGRELVREKGGCTVSLLVEPSEEWLVKQPPAEEPKEPEPSIEQRIADLEEALAMLHLEVTKVAVGGGA